MSDRDLKELFRIVRGDRLLQCSVTAAPDYNSLVNRLITLGKVHHLDVERGDIQEAILEFNRLRANPPSGTELTPEQERVIAGSFGSFCWDFPPTTDWTDLTQPPCALTTGEQ